LISLFFAEPFTLIFCNHISEFRDSQKVVLHENLQEACKLMFPNEWNAMVTRGVVGHPLIEYLLTRLEISNIPVFIYLMLKYGLFVTLDQSQLLLSHSSSQKYLVPALLPTTACDVDLWRSLRCCKTCYFVCTMRGDAAKLQSYFLQSQLRNDCFLPRNLIQRLIGKTIEWSRMADTHHEPILQKTALYSRSALNPGFLNFFAYLE